MVRLASCKPNGAVANGQTVFNRLQNGEYTSLPDSGSCIADKCAMWRWKPGRAVTKRSASPHNPHVQFSDTVHESPTHGYCGLAGHHAS